MRGFSWVRLAPMAALSLACAGPRPEVRAALGGTLPELQREIARAERAGALSDAQRRELARAVAEREIAGASGADGSQRLTVFRPCLSQLETAMSERAARGDEAAATATLLLFEAGKRRAADLVARYHEADSGAFRALAARATLEPRHAELRRQYFTDPDERVRLAAFEAAIRAPFRSQLAELLESARLDPSQRNRARAARAVGRIGGEEAVLGLLDLFTSGNDEEQLFILDAWSDSASFRAGGERELGRALHGSGLVSVSAATLLLRSSESRSQAIAVLARAIAEGTDDERRLALVNAPWESTPIQAALQEAARSPSPQLTPLLLSRLASVKGSGPAAHARLAKLAEDKGEAGLEAAYELSRLGAPTAIARLERELTHELASRRLRAALALAGLGKKEQLASRLADPSPLLRATLSCSLVVAK